MLGCLALALRVARAHRGGYVGGSSRLLEVCCAGGVTGRGTMKPLQGPGGRLARVVEVWEAGRSSWVRRLRGGNVLSLEVGP